MRKNEAAERITGNYEKKLCIVLFIAYKKIHTTFIM